MSDRFHSKYHRRNHHTYTNSANPDAGHDPIASPDSPFQGDFVLNGALSAVAPLSAVAGYFYSQNTGICAYGTTPIDARGGTSIFNGSICVHGTVAAENFTGTQGATLSYGAGLKQLGSLVTACVDNNTICLNQAGELVNNYSNLYSIFSALSADGSKIIVLSGNLFTTYRFGSGLNSVYDSTAVIPTWDVVPILDNDTIKIINGAIQLDPARKYNFGDGLAYDTTSQTLSVAPDNSTIKIVAGKLQTSLSVETAGAIGYSANKIGVCVDADSIKINGSNKLCLGYGFGGGLTRTIGTSTVCLNVDGSTIIVDPDTNLVKTTNTLKTSVASTCIQTLNGGISMSGSFSALSGVTFADGTAITSAALQTTYIKSIAHHSGGMFNSAVVTSDNRILVWGNGTNTAPGAPASVWPPVVFPFANNYNLKNPSVNITKVIISKNHLGALLSDGTLWFAGDNAQGQLSCGSANATEYQLKKVLFPSEASQPFVSDFDYAIPQMGTSSDLTKHWTGSLLSGGMNLPVSKPIVANFAVMTSLGKLFTWGNNAYGQCGLGHANPVYVPTLVPAMSSNVSQIFAKDFNTLALKNNLLYSAGFNHYGQLGQGTFGTTTSNYYFSAALIAAGSQFTGVSKILRNSFFDNSVVYALKNDATIWACGSNINGALGSNYAFTSASFFKQVSNVTNAIDFVSTGGREYVSCMALTQTGKIYSWGYNVNGQLGLGTTTTSYSVATPISYAFDSGVKFSKLVSSDNGSGASLLGGITTDNFLHLAGYRAPNQYTTFAQASPFLSAVAINYVSQVEFFGNGSDAYGTLIKDTKNRLFLTASDSVNNISGPLNVPVRTPTEITKWFV